MYKEDWTQNYDPGRNPVNHSPCHMVSINYKKTRKPQLKYEIKYDLHKIAAKK